MLGVITGDGAAVAFPAGAAREALAAGDEVTLGGVELFDDGGGLRARTTDGTELTPTRRSGSHGASSTPAPSSGSARSH